jgi:hypothetical protein
MRKIYIFLFFLCGAFFLDPSAATAQNMQYTGGSSVFISISDGKKSYEFTTPQIKGRYNNRLRRFEFLMSVQNAAPRHLVPQIGAFLTSLFNSVFRPDQSEGVQLLVYMPDETRNFDAFVNSRRLTLPGEVVVAGQSYKVPVTMTLKLTGPTLYYGLQGNITADFGSVAAADNQPVYAREVQFVVPESPMLLYFED